MLKQIILYELILKFKGTKLEENNNTATMFAYIQIINLRILKLLI